MKYKYIFGPVPSRRLGVSLGVDIVKNKTCNLNCVYCECGNTTFHTNEQKEYVNPDEVLEEIKNILETGIYLDCITFSGSGEPTLNSSIGYIIEKIKEITDVKVAVLTNGICLSNKNTAEGLLKADIIAPSLDAVSQDTFEKINKPVEGIKIENVLEGIINFRKMYNGKLLLEIFIIDGINNSEREIAKYRELLKDIKPDMVQINTLDRPPAESWVRPCPVDKLEYFAESLDYPFVELITKYKSRENIKGYNHSMEEMILNMLEKRPCTIEDIEEITGGRKVEINKYLDVLEKEKKVRTIAGERGIFIKKIQKNNYHLKKGD